MHIIFTFLHKFNQDCSILSRPLLGIDREYLLATVVEAYNHLAIECVKISKNP